MLTEKDYKRDGRWHDNIRYHPGKGRTERPWQARITQGRGQTGAFPSLSAARAWRTKELARLQSGTVVGDPRLTLEHYLRDRWLPFYQGHHRYSSYTVRESDCRNHIIPALGSFRIMRLSPTVIQQFYQSLTPQHKTATVRRIGSTLNAALNQAVKWELLPRNPAQGATLPSQEKRVATIWTPDELQRFLAAEDDPDWLCLWTTLALTGMRRGELLALRWDDVDWAESTLRIERTLTKGERGYVVGPTKTRGSQRIVSIPPPLLTLLRETQQRQEGLPIESPASGMMLPAQVLFPRSFSALDWRFTRNAGRANIPIHRQHDLRHAYVTVGLTLGIPMKVLSERVGHANIGITAAIYAHVTRELDRDAADRIAANLLGRPANGTDDEHTSS